MTAIFRQDSLGAERRKYIRLDSVFPVQFCISGLDGKTQLSGWLQGFTNNIGKGGICLAVNNLDAGIARLIREKQVRLSLEIDMPLAVSSIPAVASVAWIRDVAGHPDKYLIGLSYEEISPAANARIMRYAVAKKLFVPVVSVVIIVLGIGFIIGSYINVKLIKGNKALVEQLVGILQESSAAKQTIKSINKERAGLQLKMQALELRIKEAEGERSVLEKIAEDAERSKLEEKAMVEERSRMEVAQTAQKINEFNVMIQKLAQEKFALQEELIAVQNKESSITEELLRLDKKKSTLEKANLDKMYQWLKIHQNQRTGLIMSFEGDGDIANWGFLYDQSLVGQAFTYFSDFERAKTILNFFDKKAKRANGLFYNAYYVNDGDVAEGIVHSGPNIWLGITALQYIKKSQDPRYMKMAEQIADGIIGLQNQDGEGGIRGGPDVEWYATEHNLDAYAFFNMLYNLTSKNKYMEARDKVLKWLVNNTYNKSNPPIKRGKGDATIATDTYAWSIAAIGPQRLQEVGMNPDMIMDFAEKNCSVNVTYQRPGGVAVKVKGFDFAPARHVARGGLVSSEWTAQMVISFKIMAEFYYKKDMVAKARAYEFKADEYLGGLGNMIISSPSPSGQGESCMPYATQDFADTGHGWSTPKGKSTGSVAGTTYTIFAYYNYNPLELK